ncbi:uncharacterized abhydrolase domain-containing protein DDB_G0269086-like [Centroberyx affinis]|uniref:uncharacterized abhydrolase domain-containing protein DDB_G0269086-like n=1 Tax=Centroberyx affinis TaxID=166261 RepID=UPI003A5C4B17
MEARLRAKDKEIETLKNSVRAAEKRRRSDSLWWASRMMQKDDKLSALREALSQSESRQKNGEKAAMEKELKENYSKMQTLNRTVEALTAENHKLTSVIAALEARAVSRHTWEKEREELERKAEQWMAEKKKFEAHTTSEREQWKREKEDMKRRMKEIEEMGVVQLAERGAELERLQLRLGSLSRDKEEMEMRATEAEVRAMSEVKEKGRLFNSLLLALDSQNQGQARITEVLEYKIVLQQPSCKEVKMKNQIQEPAAPGQEKKRQDQATQTEAVSKKHKGLRRFFSGFWRKKKYDASACSSI